MDSKKLFGKKALLDNIDFIDYVILINKDNSLINLLNQKQIKYQFINKQYFNKFDHSLNHQGIVSFLKQPKSINNLDDFLKLSKDKSIVLIIDSIQDPQNFGAILRTCDAFNVDAVIYKKDNQVQINDFVIKSSMGAINYLNMIRVSNLSNIVQVLKKAGY
jgi:23S rRNA (guanosine2251-2'-O)-methyltransferase